MQRTGRTRLLWAAVGFATGMIGALNANAAATWDGASGAPATGSSDIDGIWSLSTNWSGDAVPVSTDAVTLGSVTAATSNAVAGTRSVTIDAAQTALSLTMVQATADKTNALVINGGTLSLAGTATGANQTLFSQSLTSGSISVNVINGGLLDLTNNTSTGSATKYFNNLGTVSIGDATTSGTLKFTSSNAVISRINNLGVINVSAGAISRTAATAVFQFNNGFDGTTTNTNAELNFLRGANFVGALVDPGNATGNNRFQNLDNYGKLTIANATTLTLNSNVTSSGAAGAWFVNNKAGGSITLGSSTTSGAAILRMTSNSASNSNNFTISSDGVMSLYGQSAILNNVTSSTTYVFQNNATGTLNLVGDATGVRLGTDSRTLNINFTNAGTLNASNFTGSGGGATGLATIGNFEPNNNTFRGAVTLTNTATGQINVRNSMTLRLQAKRANQNYLDATLTNAGNLSIGVSGVTSTGGNLQFLLTNGSSNTNADDGTHGAIFNNSGTADLYGTSSLAVSPDSVALTDSSVAVPLYVTNSVGGVLNLNDTARIGQTGNSAVFGTVAAKPLITLFNNAGTLRKLGAGVATVQSAAGGTATNSGTVDVQAGTLAFSSVLSSSGTITGSGVLSAASVTSTGRLSPGAGIATLGITGDTAIGDGGRVDLEINSAAAGQTVDLLNISGNLDLSSVLDSLYLAGTLDSGTSYVLAAYTGTLSGQFNSVYWNNILVTDPLAGGIGADGAFKLSYGTGSGGTISLNSIPEPRMGLGLVLAPLLWSRVRRRRRA